MTNTTRQLHPVLIAMALSLGAAVALGITRFSYGLLLPPMRADLGWSYATAGGMNTANAMGYFIGALLTPWLFRRCSPYAALMAGVLTSALFMTLSGLVTDTGLLMIQRLLAGISSSWTFVAGSLLAARLGARHPGQAGWLLGIYYGGCGLGIVVSAISIPLCMDWAERAAMPHPWQAVWITLGALCLLAAWLMRAARHIPASGNTQGPTTDIALGRFTPALAGYLMLGMGYIGYMTFVVAWLKELGLAAATITAFYSLLGLGVMASSRLWAGMLNHFKGGQSLAILTALCGLATLLPAILPPGPIGLAGVFISGLLFGGVFLSVVASTTMLVRHNLPVQAWPAGIAAFTTLFAIGQVVGPAMVGWIADNAGGLRAGLLLSASVLLLGALIASRQQSFAVSHSV